MKKIFSIIIFELKYWSKKPSVYVNFSIVFLFSLLIFTFEKFSIASSSENTFRNSPYILTNLYVFISLFLPIFLVEFISFSVSRDFEYKFHELIYSYPISRIKLYLGRFTGSLLPVLFITSAPVFADLIAPIIPWSNAHQLKPFSIHSHLWNILLTVVPNVWIIGWILFYFTSLLKSKRYAVMISVGFIALYLSFLSISSLINNSRLISLADPFGLLPLLEITQKQSVYEQNHVLVTPDRLFYINRFLWFSLSLLLCLLSFRSIGRKLLKTNFKSEKKSIKKADTYKPKPGLSPIYKKEGLVYSLRVLHEEALSGLKFIYKSNIFVVFLSTIFLILFLRYIGAVQSDEATKYATTSNILEYFDPLMFILNLYVIFIIGELFWREKEYFFQEIKFSLPSDKRMIFLGKVFSVIYFYFIVSSILIVLGILYQLVKSDAPLKFELYLFYFFVIKFIFLFGLTILSFLLQNFLNHKFLAIGLTTLILFVQSIALSALHINSNMVGILPRLPEMIYSDFYGYGPYLKHYFAFYIYWLLIYFLLTLVTTYSYFGLDRFTFKQKLQFLKRNLAANKKVFSIILTMTLVYAGYLYYQTQIKNKYLSYNEELRLRVDYEKKFKKYENIPIPKVIHADYEIHLFGKNRKYEVSGTLILKNKTKNKMTEFIVTNNKKNPIKIFISRAKISHIDSSTIAKTELYKFIRPLEPGDTITMKFKYAYKENGIYNELPLNRLLPNGTFLDNFSFTPRIGYDEDLEISSNEERKKFNLPIKTESFSPPERNCAEKCMNNYVSPSDWATIHTIISTHEDQMAIAPGKLIKEWKQDGRNFFEYQLSQPSLFFFNVISANFAQKTEKSGNLSFEVYYHPEHHWNVEQIMGALKSSVNYFSTVFGPYYHSEARIIEFPQFSSFAQAFPGTMPYSESIGFTTDYSGNAHDINTIYHVVAHEMAHQWWAHQVAGAKLQGATLLSESFAEFSSTLVLKNNFGDDMLIKFIRKSNRDYIESRKFENYREAALYNTDNQAYIYYQKAGVVLNAIGKLIGYDSLLASMKDMIRDFAYKEPPYPTSFHFLDKLYARTPDSLKPIVKEHMEGIVIWDVNVLKKDLKKINDKNYKITLELELIKDSYNPEDRATENISESKLGKSTRMIANGLLELAAFKNSDEKHIYGNEIQRKKYSVNHNNIVLELECLEKPDKVVIDPYFLNVWRNTEKKEISL